MEPYPRARNGTGIIAISDLRKLSAFNLSLVECHPELEPYPYVLEKNVTLPFRCNGNELRRVRPVFDMRYRDIE